MEYEQLIPWVNPGEGAFPCYSGDYVTRKMVRVLFTRVPTMPLWQKCQMFLLCNWLIREGELRPMVDLTGKFYTFRWVRRILCKSVNVEPVLWRMPMTLRWRKRRIIDVSICMMMKASNKAFKIEKHVQPSTLLENRQAGALLSARQLFIRLYRLQRAYDGAEQNH